jgi:hypothetical protein
VAPNAAVPLLQKDYLQSALEQFRLIAGDLNGGSASEVAE